MSSKIKVVAFDPTHLERIQPRSCYAAGECPQTVMTAAFTFTDAATGEVIAILGGFPFIPGVIHFWGLLSDLVKRYPLSFHKECLKVLRWYTEHEKPRRMQIDVRQGYEAGCRWAEALGFTWEGTLPGWAMDGASHHLYGRHL